VVSASRRQGVPRRPAARAAVMTRDGGLAIRVAFLGTLVIACALAAVTLSIAAGDGTTAGGADRGGVASPPATPAVISCARDLEALDENGRPLFRSIAVALPRPGLAAAPLHPLERGGVRWQRLVIAGSGSDPEPVTGVAGVDAAANLAILEAPGLAACEVAAEDAPETARGIPAAGSTVRVLRERAGFRAGTIGGRVDRGISLHAGRALVLVRLVDDEGADPGLVFDAQGRFAGAALPAPPSGSRSLVAFSPWSGSEAMAPLGTPADLRLALPPRESASASLTEPGLVARALTGAGPDAAERGAGLLDEVVRREGETAPLLVERGVLRFEAGRLDAAIADFRRAAFLDPVSHIARFNLGVALGVSGRYADAADAFRAATLVDPGHARTRYQLALALRAARQAEEARRECDSLAALDPLMAADLRRTLGL
jgi:tetratricopeptide repeat protein